MNRKKVCSFLYLIVLILILTGCTRKEINRQVAESIGTLGMYEDDEPVESPKMKADKLIKERKEAIEQEVAVHVENARKLAEQYDYFGALDELALVGEDYQGEEVIDARIEYTRLSKLLDYHAGSIGHFSVGNLAVDKARAFNDPYMGWELNNWSLTVDEFKKILQQLYDNDYVLMDVTSLVSEESKEKNPKSMVLNWEGVLVPEGKKPIVLSFTGAGYEKDYGQYGYSNRMVIDTDGKVRNEYTDVNGETRLGAYDVVPIVDEFIEKHPDFSLRGARGILAITGIRGAFGYSAETEGEEIRKIADTLKEEGWLIANQGFRGVSMEADMDGKEFVEDMENWSKTLAPYVGDTELLIYPNGDELPLYTYKHLWALEHGYHFYFSQWATTDTLSLYDDCLMQSRRRLDGYDLYYYGENMTQYFDYKKVLDKDRPSFE